MKAFLLAAGLGSRLKPITDTTPKCLVELNGHPMLDWWAKLLEESGVTEILVNTHYLHGQVHDYISSFNNSHTGIQFVESYEKELLGSGGTVWSNRGFVKEEEDFLICYADNICDVKIRNMVKFHLEKRPILTMALFRTLHPEQCGIVKTDETGRILDFVEKPEHSASNLANAGIYVANKKIFEIFPKKSFMDFGKDVLPLLAGGMYGWEIKDYLLDIGTMENYEKAKAEWKYDYYKDTLTN